MVGGGSRRDESVVLNSSNVFAALGNLKKKKKSSGKEQGSSKSKAKTAEKEKEKEVFWAPTPLTVKSWADVDEDDDDDYYATTAPPQSVWSTVDLSPQKESQENLVEESESEEEGLDEVDEDVEEEHENENETAVEIEPKVMKLPETPSAERQLSKKELKKKGLEELDALLAEMGLKKESSGQDESHGAAQGKKGEYNGDVEKKEDGPAESKSAKKKKKKDKSVKEAKDLSQDRPDGSNIGGQTDETAGTEEADDTSVDVKERLKKVAPMKKKKSSKEMDAAARAAAGEAAARSAKLAAAKKKEKNHYNQQPVR
ncbi:FK506-binding protein 4-like [Mangifera indica]|uniref:FK506-binding protein 4-like n=1 Tax=Mangifera indica TaxID=29780 RepID=UPI001CFA2E51|nr:FK506-binding protein 4-like [Mangifera indica]XP_044472412.1 FK506-binding protein 4-like [Mangifera indica]